MISWRLLAAAVLALPACGCLTLEPVHESIELSFDAGGDCAVLAVARIDSPVDAPADLARRLERVRDELSRGDDAVARALTPERARDLRVSRSWSGGELSERRIEATLEASEIADALAGTGLQAWITEGEGFRELSLSGAAASRGTREQRELVERSLDRFAEALLRHARAMNALHERLERHPERAAEAYAGLLEERPPAPEGTLEAATREAAASLAELGEFFFVESGDGGWSIDSLTRLVKDPFPCDVVVRVPGEVVEAEGFVLEGDALRVPAVSPWEALRSLRGRWSEPDVAVTALEALLRDEEPDLAALAAQPRRSQPPMGYDEVRAALDEAIARPHAVRLRWAE